ncbi:hypothetical protein [Pseudobythopirellula maris]|uniref:hypothetical protein n=1 Tax=Pseudobythopirellula maris TaxID=2527991 RepID=UPI0018D418D4|nr:hypothetical protein [Pseudobythopirellula maris]
MIARLWTAQISKWQTLNHQKKIRHVQNGTGPIKFRREWLDEYIDKKAEEASPAPRRKATKAKPKEAQPAHFGLDPSLFKPAA